MSSGVCVCVCVCVGGGGWRGAAALFAFLLGFSPCW